MDHEQDRYCNILDVLSCTKKAKDYLKAENAANVAAIEAVREAEQVLVQLLLQGKKLVAFSEAELEAVQ